MRSLPFNHASTSSVPPTCQALPDHRPFAHAIFSAWNTRSYPLARVTFQPSGLTLNVIFSENSFLITLPKIRPSLYPHVSIFTFYSLADSIAFIKMCNYELRCLFTSLITIFLSRLNRDSCSIYSHIALPIRVLSTNYALDIYLLDQ